MTKLNVSSLQTIFRDTFNKKHTQIIQTHTNYTNIYKHIQTYKHTNTHNYTNTQLYLTTIILTNTPLVIQEGPDPGLV